MLKLWIISVIMGCIKKKNKKSWDYSLCQHVKSGTCKQISDKETQTQTGWLTGSHCVCSLSDHCLAVQSYWRLGYLKSWTHNPSKCSSSSHFLFHCAYFSPPPSLHRLSFVPSSCSTPGQVSPHDNLIHQLSLCHCILLHSPTYSSSSLNSSFPPPPPNPHRLTFSSPLFPAVPTVFHSAV